MAPVQKDAYQHAYVVIMAGGSGTRLWPLSQKKDPKQFHAFTGEKTMLQETFARVETVVPRSNIFISTTSDYKKTVLKQLPAIDEKRLILEPEAKNTGPAIALVATMLLAHDTDALIATIASDHVIENPEEFTATLRSALTIVSTYPDKLLTIGINPTRPDTGFGYIKMGRLVSEIAGKRVFIVDAFKEKPDQETAEVYVSDWQYLWNAGYFIFSAKVFAQWTSMFAPELSLVMMEILTQKKGGTLREDALRTLYSTLQNEPVETLIVEKLSAEERLVLPSALRWSDVGNWETLYDFLKEKTGSGLVVRHANHVDVGSKNSLIYGEKKLIVTLGVEDLVIVDTPHALFVGKRNQAGSEMKKVIEELKKLGKTDVL